MIARGVLVIAIFLTCESKFIQKRADIVGKASVKEKVKAQTREHWGDSWNSADKGRCT